MNHVPFYCPSRLQEPFCICSRAFLLVLLLGSVSCLRTSDSKSTVAAHQGDSQQASDLTNLMVTWPTRPRFHDVIDNATGKPASVLVYVEATHWPDWDPEWPRLVLAIWNDGRIVRSHDPVEGGEPYSGGAITPNEVRALIARLKTHSLNALVRPRTTYCGPSYPSTHIFFRTDDGHVFEIDSWHEYREHGGQRVFDGKYWVSLNAGRTADEIIAGADDKYKSFRSLWVLLRQNIDNTVPASLQPMATSTLRFVSLWKQESGKDPSQ